MAQKITIEVSDDGQISVMAEENGQPMGEPYQCDSVEECMQFLQSMLAEEGGEAPAEQQGEPAEDYEAMWNEEAASRKQPGLMA